MPHNNDEKKWRSMYGETKTFSEITQQHWSNIVHYHTLQIMKHSDNEGFVEKCIANVQIGHEELIKRFGGVLLPFKKFNRDDIEMK